MIDDIIEIIDVAVDIGEAVLYERKKKKEQQAAEEEAEREAKKNMPL